jgi:hypothetical protein
MIVFAFIGWRMGSMVAGAFVGELVGIALSGWLTPSRLLVYTPPYLGFLTQNAITGKNTPYGPGTRPTLPLESRTVSGNYSLKVIVIKSDLPCPTATSQIILKLVFQYARSLRNLERAVGTDSATIEEGLLGFVHSFATGWCSSKPADIVKNQLDDLNKALAGQFVDEHGQRINRPELHEEDYGFVVVSILIENVEFPPAVQKTRDAIDEAEQNMRVAAELYGFHTEDEKKEFARKVRSGEISRAEFNSILNRTMSTSENAKMYVHVIEGGGASGNTAATAAQLGQFVQNSERERSEPEPPQRGKKRRK